MTGTCAACGAVTRLGPDGVCAWQAGCEHRRMQAEAMERKIDAGTERLEGMIGGSLYEFLSGPVLPVQRAGMAFPTPSHPYDRDLAAYHERATAAAGGPVCVHCVAQSN